MTLYAFIFDDAAILDFEESSRLYAERSLNTADNFEAAISAKIAAICESPHRYPISYRHFRETAVKNFPFKIVYVVDDESAVVVVTAIYHFRRDPDQKFRAV